MTNNTKLIVSHAPFLHDGGRISTRNYNIMLATLPAVLMGFYHYGLMAVGVMALSISCSILWELLFNIITKKEKTIGDGSSAVIGIIFAMMLPATSPWWLVLLGTFIAVVIGREIFGGIGGNPFNPVLTGIAILMMSWGKYFDFNLALINYDMDFKMFYPLASLKYFGVSSIDSICVGDLMLGRQPSAIGAGFGLGIIGGGLYLIIRGFIRWEISVSFFAGVFITSMLFSIVAPTNYAGPFFHIFTGYTLLGIFFLATEDSSSPTNLLPMIIYGAGCGIMTVLIRNIGTYIDGVVLAILLMNIVNPLLDKIRPKSFGKVKQNA